MLDSVTMTVAVGKCCACSARDVGSVIDDGEAVDFACAACDRPSFDEASERQKARWLAGEEIHVDDFRG